MITKGIGAGNLALELEVTDAPLRVSVTKASIETRHKKNIPVYRVYTGTETIFLTKNMEKDDYHCFFEVKEEDILHRGMSGCYDFRNGNRRFHVTMSGYVEAKDFEDIFVFKGNVPFLTGVSSTPVEEGRKEFLDFLVQKFPFDLAGYIRYLPSSIYEIYRPIEVVYLNGDKFYLTDRIYLENVEKSFVARLVAETEIGIKLLAQMPKVSNKKIKYMDTSIGVYIQYSKRNIFYSKIEKTLTVEYKDHVKLFNDLKALCHIKIEKSGQDE